MANQYLTSAQDVLAGFACNTRQDDNPYDGEHLGALRYYKGVKSYDICMHGDEEALIFVVTDYHMLLVVARASKLTRMCEACAAEDAAYHYEDRNGKIIFRCADKGNLVHRFLNIDWSFEPEDEADGSAEEQSDMLKEWARPLVLAKDESDDSAEEQSDAIIATYARTDIKRPAKRLAVRAAATEKPTPSSSWLDTVDLSDFE